MKRITLVYFDAGGGHRSAALAVQQAVQLPYSMMLPINLNALKPPKKIHQNTMFSLAMNLMMSTNKKWISI